MSSLQDTIVALSTPNGAGAIAVIRLSGSEAIAIIQSVFSKKDFHQAASHTLHFGTVKYQNEMIDEVVLGLFRAPHSYTGENVVEISCHASSYIINRMLQILLQQGARLAKAGEFTLRAFVNGKMKLSQAEAVADLIASETQAAHQVAMRQLRGGVSQEIAALRQRLIDFAALVELELDFSEEDVAFADRRQLTALLHEILQTIERIKSTFALGNALKNGIVTVLAGRPNAGKSTLLNALLQEERAIVSPVAGTTRDTIEEILNIEGVAFRLIDTAGIREAGDQIEALGIQKTFDKVKNAAILLYVFDGGEQSAADLAADLEKLHHGNLQVVVVVNKMDLLAARSDLSAATLQLQAGGEGVTWVYTCAQSGEGLEALKTAIYDTAFTPAARQAVAGSDTLWCNTRHIEALSQAAAALQAALHCIGSGNSGELLALDLRQALHYLGTVSGEVSTEDLLESVFSRFCIGK